MKNPKLLVTITVFFWSFGTFLGRLISLRSQFLFLGLSFTFTLVTLAVHFSRQRRRPCRSRAASWRPKYLFFGLFGYFFYCVALNQSFRAFGTGSEATILNYTWPLFTVIFTQGVFNREKRNGRVRVIDALGIMAGFASVVLVASGGDLTTLALSNVAGVGWGLGAGISYGFFGAYSSTVSEEENGAFLFSAIAASWALMAVFSLSEMHLIETLTLRDMLLVATTGCLTQGVAYITWTRANRLARERGISISSIASMTFALPLLNLIWISLFLGETTLLRPYFAMSLLLVIVSAVLCQKAEAIAGYLERGSKQVYVDRQG